VRRSAGQTDRAATDSQTRHRSVLRRDRSTALGEQLDPEVLRAVMNSYFGRVLGGNVAKDGGLRSRAVALGMSSFLMGPEHVDTLKVRVDEFAAELPNAYFAAEVEFARAQLARYEMRLDDARRHVRDAVERALALGDGVEAERWARSAVDHALLTDFAMVRGEATLSLARVLQALGRQDEARTTARAALDEYERKGDRIGIQQASALTAKLGA
jgi:hypothetical protein